MRYLFVLDSVRTFFFFFCLAAKLIGPKILCQFFKNCWFFPVYPLNWIPDPVPTPPRDHGKENHPTSSQPPKLPQKMRPRRRKRGHHQQHLPGANGNVPGTDLRPKERMRTSVKYPQPPQHPQHPHPAANENLSRVNLPDQADHGRLYKRAHQTGSGNPQNDLVETTSPGHLPPSTLSGCIETTSLGRPIGQQTKISLWLTLQEKLSHSHRVAAVRRQTPHRSLHMLPCRIRSLKWDSSLQKPPQLPASRVRTGLQSF